MTQRHSVTRWLGALGLTLSLVGLVSQGTPSAQTSLGETLRMAHSGDTDAQFTLGYMSNTGQGVPQNFTEAMAWYRQAADQGHAGAQNNLGVMYANGQGVPEDDRQALGWYQRAANQGHADAQNNLGMMFSLGQGVPQNYVEALKWRSLAASRVTDDKQAEYAEARDALAKQMTPAQLAEAQKRATEWQAAFEKRQAE